MWLQGMPRERAAALRSALERHPSAVRGVEYPGWYFRRWHFLPDGYCSARSAALYDRLIRPLYWAGSEGRVVALLARWLERTGARHVLEVGPGPGRLLAALRARLPGIEFRAIELSPYFVATATQRLGEGVVAHGDGRDLRRVSRVFDAVIAAHYVGHLPRHEQQAAIAALAEAARPGGTVVMVEHRWHRLLVPGELRPAARRAAGFSTVQFYRRFAGEGAGA
jgi:SAM-dependent methyltransferase